MLNQAELEILLEQEEQGAGGALQGLFDQPRPDAEEERNELRHRFSALAQGDRNLNSHG